MGIPGIGPKAWSGDLGLDLFGKFPGLGKGWYFPFNWFTRRELSLIGLVGPKDTVGFPTGK